MMFATVMPHLDERQRRILTGAQARCLGRGGIVSVSEMTGMSPATVQSAVGEVVEEVEVTGLVRALGAGRPKAGDKDPTLIDDLDRLVDPVTRDDPICVLRWTCKSTEHLAGAIRSVRTPWGVSSKPWGTRCRHRRRRTRRC